jgi:hypothetical protein
VPHQHPDPAHPALRHGLHSVVARRHGPSTDPGRVAALRLTFQREVNEQAGLGAWVHGVLPMWCIVPLPEADLSLVCVAPCRATTNNICTLVRTG